MPKIPNIDKIRGVIEEYIIPIDEEFSRNFNVFKNINRANHKITFKEASKEFRASNVLMSDSETIFIPNKKRFENAINYYKEKGNDVAVRKLNKVKNMLSVITTAAVAIFLKEYKSSKAKLNTYLINEDFFDEIKKFAEIYYDLEKFIIDNGGILHLKFRRKNLDKKIIELMYLYQFLKIHELIGHIKAKDLKKDVKKKYFKAIANIVYDLRIHALREGIIFNDLFRRFKKFFKNGVYRETFVNFMKEFDMLYQVAKYNLSKKEIEKKFGKDFAEKIDMEKVKTVGKDIVKRIDEQMKIYFRYYETKKIIPENFFKDDDLPLKSIEKFLEYFEQYSLNKKFIASNSYQFEKIFHEISDLYELLKSKKDDEGEGKGNGESEGNSPQIPHDEDNEVEFDEDMDKENDISDEIDEETDKELNEKYERASREREKLAGKVLDIDSDEIFAGTSEGFLKSKIQRDEKIIINELLEEFSRIFDLTKTKTTKPVLITKEMLFTGAVPDYIEVNIDEVLSEEGFITEGFANVYKKYYAPDPIIITVIDNSGSMSQEVFGRRLIDLFKNAVANTLCEKDVKVLNIDWDTNFKDVVALNKNTQSYNQDLEKFMKFNGAGGTKGFGELFNNFPEIVKKHENKFDNELKKLGMKSKDLIDRWERGEVSFVYLTDGELLDFKGEINFNDENIKNIFKMAELKDFPLFNFIIPSNKTSEYLKNLLGERLKKLAKIYEITGV